MLALLIARFYLATDGGQAIGKTNGQKSKPDLVAVAKLEECTTSIVQSLVRVQTQIDECKHLEEIYGEVIELEPITSLDIGISAMRAATVGFNRSSRMHGEKDLESELHEALKVLAEFQSAVDEVAENANSRGKAKVFCWSSAQQACDRLSGFAKKIEETVAIKKRELSRV